MTLVVATVELTKSTAVRGMTTSTAVRLSGSEHLDVSDGAIQSTAMQGGLGCVGNLRDEATSIP